MQRAYACQQEYLEVDSMSDMELWEQEGLNEGLLFIFVLLGRFLTLLPYQLNRLIDYCFSSQV